jgi:hypothetical protein
MNDTIEGVELLVIVDLKSRNKEGSGTKLRVVQWVVNGQSKSVKVEKRQYYLDAYGKTMTGKAEGFSLDDLNALKPHWPRVLELMRNPPAVKTPEPVAAAAASDAIDEVPF